MKTIHEQLVTGMLLATASTGLGQAPVITLQPTNQTACRGTDVTFAVGASGAESLFYRWQKSSDYLNYYDLPDCTNATLVVSNVQAADAIYYLVIVTNVGGAVTSEVARLTLAFLPSISASGQPTNWSGASLGASVANRVIASGTAPFTYQWRLNGIPISGQTKSSIILTNLLVTDAGDYDVVVANKCGSIASSTNTLMIDTTFTKITAGVLVNDVEGSITGNWADYNNDSYPDVYVANSASSAGSSRNTLYRNEGGTNFSRVAASPFSIDYMRTWMAAWGDYNNDGNVDLMAVNLDGGTLAQRLYKNNGDGTFTPVVDSALRSDSSAATCPWWFDYDNDGFLDLFVTKGMPYGGSAANDCLFRNLGDGTFKKMTAAEVGPIVNDSMGTEACWSVDYDNDGQQELHALHTKSAGSGWSYTNIIWRSQGGLFKMVSLGVPYNVLPFCWGDYDNNGLLDGFGIGSDSSSRWPVLYSNQGRGVLLDATASLHVITNVPLWQATWGDYDNDGWLDLFCTGGYWISAGIPNGLFHNNRDGTFTQAVTGSLVWDGDRRATPTWADFDNDGFLDLFIAVGDAVPQKNRLYRNNRNTNHWLKVILDGRASNRSGIGAKVRAQANINGQTFWQVREISCGNSYAGQNGLLAHFGLGDATNVTTLKIEWPSGIVQELQNVAADQFLPVSEHQVYTGPSPAITSAIPGTNGLQLSIVEPAAPAVYALEASTNLVTWTKLMAQTSAGGAHAYTDARATNYSRRFYRIVVP